MSDSSDCEEEFANLHHMVIIMHACDHMIQMAKPCDKSSRQAMSDSSDCEEEFASCPGLSQAKKARVERSGGTGRFMKSWKLPKFITASSKGNKHAYCQLCSKHFSVAYCGFRDIQHHCEGMLHQERMSESSKNVSLSNMLPGKSSS